MIATRWYSLVILSSLTLLLTGPSSSNCLAQDAAKRLDNAKEQIANKQYDKALESINNVVPLLWEHIPFSAAKSLLVKRPAPLYGGYEPRENNEFSPDEPILVYVEPVGYKVKREGEFNVIRLAADFSVVDESGNILGGKKEFVNWTLKSRSFMTQFMINLTYNLTKIKSGQYVVYTTLKDKNGDSTVTIRTPIVIR